MKQTDTKPKGDTGGSRKWGLILGIIAVLVMVSPLFIGVNVGRIAIALFIGGLFLVAAVSVASDEVMDGPPPKRTG